MTLLLIPLIGLVIIFFERRHMRSYKKVLEDFIEETLENEKLSQAQKKERIERLLRQNGYAVYRKEGTITGKRKIFSLGVLLLSFFLYLLYYHYIQKPHTLTVRI
jgi:hypothetical protein